MRHSPRNIHIIFCANMSIHCQILGGKSRHTVRRIRAIMKILLPFLLVMRGAISKLPKTDHSPLRLGWWDAYHWLLASSQLPWKCCLSQREGVLDQCLHAAGCWPWIKVHRTIRTRLESLSSLLNKTHVLSQSMRSNQTFLKTTNTINNFYQAFVFSL